MTDLPERLFTGLDNLQTLGLYENPLLGTLKPGIFQGLRKLYYLYLDENYLVDLPSGLFTGLKSLNRLYLQYNKLTTLPVNLFWGLE